MDKRQVTVLTDGAAIIRFQQNSLAEQNKKLGEHVQKIADRDAEIERLRNEIVDMKMLSKELRSSVDIVRYNMVEALNEIMERMEANETRPEDDKISA